MARRPRPAWPRRGFSSLGLIGWVIFDTALASRLFAAARRPRPLRLLLLALVAGVDAAVSLLHLRQAGLATIGPVIGTTTLAWAASLSRDARR